MRVIFMGTPDFAVPTLDALVEAGHEIVAVVAQPDRPKGRGQKMVSPPTVQRVRRSVSRQAAAGGAPGSICGVDDERVGADVAVVVAYGRILIPDLLNAPTHGASMSTRACCRSTGGLRRLTGRWCTASPSQGS